MSPLIHSLLKKRGITSEAEAAAYLNPDYDNQTHDPFLLENMERAVARLLTALEKRERIAVYADFDCDGIPGASVLSDFFSKIGYENVEIYIPHRDLEGYGFHQDAIRALATRGVTLIITVDVGTTAVESARLARELGIDVIVTDHHEIIGELPEALAILNPKLGDYPFRDICGAAVAFKLVQAALVEGKRRGIPEFAAIPSGWEKWLLDLVGIATVADMVPLVGENRVLAHYGLRVLRKSPRPGIVALCDKLRLRQRELTEDDIGFSIAPRINAASRMDEPRAAFELLTTRDPLTARERAAHLESLNASRKGVVAGIVKQAKKRARARFPSASEVVVLGDPEWKPSLVGLAANSVVEERGGVACLWGRDAAGRIRGSCRSDGSASVVDMFTGARGLLAEFGGHERSGGFTVSHEQVHGLADAFADAVRVLRREPAAPPQPTAYDARAPLADVTWALFRDVSTLAPFGIGNPKPLFSFERLVVTDVRRFGKERNHIELRLECRDSGASVRAYDFFRSPERFSAPPSVGMSASVLGTLERDTYRGALALRLVDVLPE